MFLLNLSWKSNYVNLLFIKLILRTVFRFLNVSFLFMLIKLQMLCMYLLKRVWVLAHKTSRFIVKSFEKNTKFYNSKTYFHYWDFIKSCKFLLFSLKVPSTYSNYRKNRLKLRGNSIMMGMRNLLTLQSYDPHDTL